LTLVLNDPGLLRFENRIGARWVPPGAASIAVSNPATGEVIGQVPRFGAAEAREAIEAAAAALPGWRAQTAGERAATLRALSGLLLEHLEDLALACACASGHEGAWEHFVREYRPLLYRAADAIDHV